MKGLAHHKLNLNRNSNLELLRILSMILIVMHHYSVHGGFDLSQYGLSFNKVIVQLLSLGGKLGVNCFVLITGYFMINSKFKLKKLFKILFQVFFYSFSIVIIFYGLGIVEPNFKIILKSLFPTIFNLYWFSTTYIVLYVLTPFINKFIKTISKKELISLIIILVSMWCIIPTFTTASLAFSEVGWFFTLYLIASYIRLYPNNFTSSCKYNVIIASCSYTILIISVIIFDILGTKIGFFASKATYFAAMNKLPIFICSVSMLLIFKNINMKSNRFINNLSMTMFGVYLIHDNPIIRPFLWESVFKNNLYIDSPYLLIHAIGSIVIVFICCSMIDYIRIRVVERPLFNLINRYEDRKKVGFITEVKSTYNKALKYLN